MGGKSIQSLFVSDLAPGDLVILRTTNSTYKFWAEFPGDGIGVMCGGALVGPTRVRLTPEGVDISESESRPLFVGDRAHTTVLGPNGAPVRSIVTSTIGSIKVVPAGLAAA